ncbi:MAG: hypothetical protein ABSD73_12160 [Candidatus Bathyarchaeia archaeon]|jgi:SAM-dependent methyltransferase
MDTWREAILTERKSNKIHEPMKKALSYTNGHRNNALILGDASLVQSKYLIEVEKFSRVVDVDISPALLDDGPVGRNDQRLERVVKPFDEFLPPTDTFDFIYGKSIAFNPKKTVRTLLDGLNHSLKSDGIFCAVWAAEGDSFRNVQYTEEELRRLYSNSGLEIIDLDCQPAVPNRGLLRPGISHTINVIAKKTE